MQPTPKRPVKDDRRPDAPQQPGQGAPAAADAVLRVVRNIDACTFAWEDRTSDNKKAVRVTVDGWKLLIDVHPCRMGTVTTPQGFFMGGAYVRDGGPGNECNLDALAEAHRDDLGFDLRDVFIRRFAQLFPDEIAAMIANKDAKSPASQNTNWRNRQDPPKPPPGAPGGTPSGAPTGRKPWHRDETP
ncbi:hypothetical protein [Streptomyces sp. NRRL F-5123]|uniref:hypothetical protein n=1 Tax=Streptomyces sp. NRRL F-5123 TaxID=1463856 RepID=UPI0004E2829A|nr:hypothetical protein [Streptomyces sp. NRRL F-5123]